jgi:excinuclease ABC subunit C
VTSGFHFDHHLDFHPSEADSLLRSIPAAPGIFALRGPNAPDGSQSEPYLTHTTDLRRRLRRLLGPPEAAPAALPRTDESGKPILSKRLNLREKVRSIDYTRTGSDFESTLLLYNASRAAFGPEAARRRLRLHAPYFLRITMSHEHPRVYSTNRLSKKSLPESFGPFPSRAAADRYCDAVLDLFLLRRCYEDLQPHPSHPGCIFGDIKKCMQPCKSGSTPTESINPQGCTPEQYAAESQRVFDFFRTRGQSLLDEVAAQREAASESMDFELAATLHKHWEKVRSAALLADELVRPVPDLRAAVLQTASPAPDEPGTTSPVDAALFLLDHGHLLGPTRLSTLGVRAVREQTAVGSSLFAQPLMLAPVPLAEFAGPLAPAPQNPHSQEIAENALPKTQETPEKRAETALKTLENTPDFAPEAEISDLCDALSLFRRWYYRPEKQRSGEVFLPNPDGFWPIRRLLNGAARVVLGPPAASPPVVREAAKTLKTKIIHAGREGVEREVPVLPRRPRRKAPSPTDPL